MLPSCAESGQAGGGRNKTTKQTEIFMLLLLLLEIPGLVLTESAKMVTLEVRWECRQTQKERGAAQLQHRAA